MSILADLGKWYASNCDGEWEHELGGIAIKTMSDPGWMVTVNLAETNLEDRQFQPIRERVSDDSWIDCRIEERKFQGLGDASRLEEILTIFVEWAKSQNENWLQPPPPMSAEEQQKLNDEEFLASLRDEVETERCQREGCMRDRIRYSVLCRRHHFEMVTGRRAPDDR